MEGWDYKRVLLQLKSLHQKKLSAALSLLYHRPIHYSNSELTQTLSRVLMCWRAGWYLTELCGTRFWVTESECEKNLAGLESCIDKLFNPLLSPLSDTALLQMRHTVHTKMEKWRQSALRYLPRICLYRRIQSMYSCVGEDAWPFVCPECISRLNNYS